MERLILTDADGVLLDWLGEFTDHMIELGHQPVPEADIYYNLGKRFDMCQLDALEIGTRFNESTKMRNLRPYKDAVKYVKLLSEQGFKFVVISSMSDKDLSKAYRMENLRNLFGDCMIDLHGLHPSEDKQRTLLEWADRDLFWIEDHFKNAVAGHEVGLSPILVSNEYNQKFKTDLFPATSIEEPWKEIYDIICEKYNL